MVTNHCDTGIGAGSAGLLRGFGDILRLSDKRIEERE
jgi:hypothetical protein